MKLKWSTGQHGHPPVATVPSFDFIVAERPKYIPGSGPPLAPITVMPPHDKDGFIIDKVQFKRQLRYLVGYDQYPQLKVSVQPQNILDWVSRYALEEWEWKHYDAEERRRKEEELPAILAKEERRRKRVEAMSRAAQGIDGRKLKRKRPTDGDTPGESDRPAKVGRVGRPHRTKSTAQRSPSREDQPEEEMFFTSPRLSQRSPLSQQPSLSTPSRRFINPNMIIADSDDDSADTEMAIDFQLGLKDRKQPSRTSNKSIDQLSKRQTRSPSSSIGADSSHDKSRSNTSVKPNRRPSILSDQSAVAVTSSREALKIYEDLERINKPSSKPLLAETQSLLEQKSSLFSSYAYKHPNSTFSIPPPSQPPQSGTEPKEPQSNSGFESNEEESEYELHQILDEDVRKENGKQVIYYLINWVGDYEDTWEPADNVSPDAIEDFKERLRKKRTSMRVNNSGECSIKRDTARNGEHKVGKGARQRTK